MLFSSDLFHCTILSHDIYYQKNFLNNVSLIYKFYNLFIFMTFYDIS